MLHALLTAALVLTAVTSAPPSNAALAVADRQQFPQADWWRYYYLDSSHLPEDQRYAAGALMLMVPSASRQPVLERCTPVTIGESLQRIDLADLGWDYGVWRELLATYPYSDSRLPLLLRSDWVLLLLADGQESDAYYRLLFGGTAPKTRDEALKILGVNASPDLQFGQIVRDSGVSVQGYRLVRNLSANRGYAWGTADVLALGPDQDPLEQPEGDFRHDGEEWIVGLPKTHLATGTRGVLQAYFLANGAGEIVDRAPVDLVVDHSRFRGLQEIRNAGSCIQCHSAGLNALGVNVLRETIQNGVRVLAYYDDQQALEQFHFADINKEIQRNNEDFQAIVRCCCGVPSDEAVMTFQAAVTAYDQPLDLSAAARELGAEPGELKLALGYASAYGYRLGARMAALAHGGKVSRDAWESQYLTVQSLYAQWEQSQ